MQTLNAINNDVQISHLLRMSDRCIRLSLSSWQRCQRMLWRALACVCVSVCECLFEFLKTFFYYNNKQQLHCSELCTRFFLMSRTINNLHAWSGKPCSYQWSNIQLHLKLFTLIIQGVLLRWNSFKHRFQLFMNNNNST